MHLVRLVCKHVRRHPPVEVVSLVQHLLARGVARLEDLRVRNTSQAWLQYHSFAVQCQQLLLYLDGDFLIHLGGQFDHDAFKRALVVSDRKFLSFGDS